MPVLSTHDQQPHKPRCVVCASLGHDTEIQDGHCCPRCRATILRGLSDILRLAIDAALYIEPGRGTGASTPVPASRPPINLDAIDPHNTVVPQFPGQQHAPTVLELLENAEREIRQARRLAPYGLASASRRTPKPTPRANVTPDGHTQPDRGFTLLDERRRDRLPHAGDANLTGVIQFLQHQIDWITTSHAFGLEDFAETIRDCTRALQRFSTDQNTGGTVVLCPTIHDDGTTCARRLRVVILREIDGRDDHRESVWCRSCGAVRKPDQLLAASGADDAYLPAALLSEHLGIPESTIRTWATSGRVSRDGRRYRFGDVRDLVIARMTRRGRGA